MEPLIEWLGCGKSDRHDCIKVVSGSTVDARRLIFSLGLQRTRRHESRVNRTEGWFTARHR